MSLKTLFIIILCFTINTLDARFSKPAEHKNITIIFDPAGDTQHTGRKVGDRYERSITLQYVQEIKKQCAHLPYVNIIVTRSAGYTRTEFDTAQLANRMQADLVIFFAAAHQREGPTTLSLYRFSYSPHFLPQPSHPYAFIPYSQAYAKSAKMSEDYGLLLKQSWDHEEYRRLFTLKGLFAIPYKPLIGIQVPALAIELSLKQGTDWQSLVTPVTNAIIQLIKSIEYDEHE